MQPPEEEAKKEELNKYEFEWSKPPQVKNLSKSFF